MRLLIVEDDKRLSHNLQRMLTQEGWTSDITESGSKALEMADVEEYDLIILDWMLPDIDGVVVCKRLRKTGYEGPILFLTAKSEIEDKVRGFQHGADDYLTKPFAKDELLVRIKALIRRRSGKADPVITISDLSLDTNTHEVKRAGKVIYLAPREYSLLEYLALNKCKALGRFEILNHVWGEGVDEFSNTVDVHIRYLRKKVDEKFDEKLIKTVKGKGYMLCGNSPRNND